MFGNAVRFYRGYQDYLGHRLHLVFVLSFLAAMAEGLGIALVLPVLSLLGFDGGGATRDGGAAAESLSAIQRSLHEILLFLGIENSLYAVLGFIGLVFLLKGLLGFAEGSYRSALGAELQTRVRAELLSGYASMEYLYYTERNSGHFVNVVGEQVTSLVKSFEHYRKYLAALLTAVAFFGFAFLIHWPFASMALVAGGLILVLFTRMSRYVRRLSRAHSSETGHLNHLLLQAMSGYRYLLATHRTGPLRERAMESVARLSDNHRRRGVAQAVSDAFREPVAVAILIGLIVVQIALLGSPLAPVLVALVLIYRAVGQLMTVQVSWQHTLQQFGSLELIQRETAALRAHQQRTGDRRVPPLLHGLEFDSVTYRYRPDEEPVLRNVSLRIPCNHTVAVVGESGSGKSTIAGLATLILRPSEGEVRIEGIPHAEVEVSSWRDQVGYVSQESVVFDDTVAHNITLQSGNVEACGPTRDRMLRAARRAGAEGFIERLPDGYATRVGDRGVRLSGGQRQRLFLARELFKEPRLLILDEATSALDGETELIVQNALEELRGTMTVLVIAHRLSTIRRADFIYVLDSGRVIESGTYEELVTERRGAFARMVELQTL